MENQNSELAFNMNGEPFEVPAGAVGWRVRRMKAKGAPEVVYGRNGLPLVLPIEAELDDVRAEAGTAGRYRLDPVDDGNKPIANAPAAYVYLHEERTHAPAVATTTVLGTPSDNVVIEAMRMNAEITRSVVDRFPMMMEAAATLLRAADGAGLPARLPLAKDEPDDDDDDDTDDDGDAEAVVGSGFDLNNLVAQLVPLIIGAFASGKVKVPSLGALFDWRKASPKTSDVDVAPSAAEAVTPEPAPSISHLPPLDPKTMVHFVAIQQTLTPQEGQLARAIAADLSPTELRGWFDELSKLSVSEAAAKIRSLIGSGNAKHAAGPS